VRTEKMISTLTLKQADIEWQSTELEISRLEALERRLQAHYNKLVGEKAKNSTDGLIKGIQLAIREQLQYQQRLENFLIENEAPGWTST
jgi:hypothetical protein